MGGPILTAISCLGASPTPAAGAHRGVRHVQLSMKCSHRIFKLSQLIPTVLPPRLASEREMLAHWGATGGHLDLATP